MYMQPISWTSFRADSVHWEHQLHLCCQAVWGQFSHNLSRGKSGYRLDLKPEHWSTGGNTFLQHLLLDDACSVSEVGQDLNHCEAQPWRPTVGYFCGGFVSCSFIGIYGQKRSSVCRQLVQCRLSFKSFPDHFWSWWNPSLGNMAMHAMLLLSDKLLEQSGDHT